ASGSGRPEAASAPVAITGLRLASAAGVRPLDEQDRRVRARDRRLVPGVTAEEQHLHGPEPMRWTPRTAPVSRCKRWLEPADDVAACDLAVVGDAPPRTFGGGQLLLGPAHERHRGD